MPPPQQDAHIRRLLGFTLAEVLITLGIIGVVAALTIPNLISTHRKKVTETRLKATYSILNQAIKLSEIQNGEASDWTLPNSTWNGKHTIEFLNKYIIPFIKSDVSTRNDESNYAALKLNNGIYTYWSLTGYNTLEIYTRFNHNYSFTSGIGGKDYFIFMFYPSIGRVEPFEYKTQDLKCTSHQNCCNASVEGYHAFCTELIRRNGWQIPDDYPFRF